MQPMQQLRGDDEKMTMVNRQRCDQRMRTELLVALISGMFGLIGILLSIFLNQSTNNEVTGLEGITSGLVSDFAEMHIQLSNTQAQISALQTELSDAHGVISQLQSELATANSQLNHTTAQAVELEAYVSGLNATVTNLDLTNLDATIQDLKVDAMEITEQINTVGNITERLTSLEEPHSVSFTSVGIYDYDISANINWVIVEIWGGGGGSVAGQTSSVLVTNSGSLFEAHGGSVGDTRGGLGGTTSNNCDVSIDGGQGGNVDSQGYGGTGGSSPRGGQGGGQMLPTPVNGKAPGGGGGPTTLNGGSGAGGYCYKIIDVRNVDVLTITVAAGGSSSSSIGAGGNGAVVISW